MFSLSVTIITFNEENNIARCLKSVEKVADEIIVVDSFSTDRTREVCESFKVKFFENEFQGHIEQKNYALKKASFDYVLSLDADEALDETLINSILEAKENFTSSSYHFKRLTHYVDKWIYHCGWYPDVKLRLFNKNQGLWAGENPHDIVKMNSGEPKSQPLDGHILHYSYNSISDHISQTNKFTTIAAKAAYNNGARSSVFKIITRPILKFLKDYVLKRGFLDGRYGLIICYINSLSALLKYSKLKDLERGMKIDE